MNLEDKKLLVVGSAPKPISVEDMGADTLPIFQIIEGENKTFVTVNLDTQETCPETFNITENGNHTLTMPLFEDETKMYCNKVNVNVNVAGGGGGSFDYETAPDYIEDFKKYFKIDTYANQFNIRSYGTSGRPPYGTVVMALVLFKLNLTNPSGETFPFYAPCYIQATPEWWSDSSKRLDGRFLYACIAPTKTVTHNNQTHPYVLTHSSGGGAWQSSNEGPYAAWVGSNYMTGWSFTYESYKCVFYQEVKIVEPY